FIQYNPTSLERNYKYEVLTEHDLGVEIDLINKDTYAGDVNAQLDPADEKLLEEDILTPQDSKRSRHHARSVSWLRRTEYISTEQTRFQPQTVDKVEAKVGYSIKKNFKEETLYMDRESQIKAIEKTFEDNKKPIERHYSKPNVLPVEILPVFPDFKLWKYPCAQVIFDSDPAPAGRSVPAQIEEMSQAMIRGVMDESGEQFVAYFLPLEETLEKRRRDFTAGIDYADDDEYEYKMAREYNWNVKSKASKGYEENYFLVIRQDGVYYNELETRVRLSKRRQKVGQQPNNTRLIVRHRPLNANEFKMQRYREKQLEPPGEEDEDEEEEEEEEEEPQQEAEKTEDRDQNLVQRHHQSLDLVLGHVLNLSLLLDLIANQDQDQDLVPHSPEILQNRGPDQSQLQDLVLDPQLNLDLDLQPNLDLDLQLNLDLDLQLNLDLDLQPNLDLDPHQVRNLDRSRDPPSHNQDQPAAVVVNLILMAPKNKENKSGNKKRKQISEEEDDEDYRRRRDRNNQAVKRSRVKSKLRTQQTLERVNRLKTENELLEEKIKMLTKELGFLKDLFLAHAGSSQHSVNFQDVDLNDLLAEDTKSIEQMKETSKP
ncbi:unnamed protein product, partial [Heterotrigona itama]